MMKRMMVMAVVALAASGAMGLTMEDPIATGGWAATWSSTMSWDIYVTGTNTLDSWWTNELLAPGAQDSPYMNKWYFRTESDYTLGTPLDDLTKWGIEWIDPSWSGKPADKAAIAAYITPGIILGQETHSEFGVWGFQAYRPWLHPDYEDKDYFKTYARVATVNGQGAEFCIRAYAYNLNNTPPSPWNDKSICTLLNETCMPLSGVDYQWQDFQYAVAKPTDGDPNTHAWFELSIVNGNANTVLYIDECRMVSDQYITIFPADFNHNFIVAKEDLRTLAAGWLSSGGLIEPRDSGMLVNGDFNADLDAMEPNELTNLYPGMTPTGWTQTGSAVEGGAFGLARVNDLGYMNFTSSVLTPLGGTVAIYANDPGYVFEQTTTETAVNGQTYYVMLYAMAVEYDSWKDFVTVTLEIGGTDVASFVRSISQNRWRPIYGTYTAQAADAGKPITVKLTYANEPEYTPDSGLYYIGYVYLDDTMPAEWPEERDNVLVNGAFEYLDFLKNSSNPDWQALYQTIFKSDNYGTWFQDNPPTPPNWVYEVPSGFNEQNEGGIIASGYHGSPLPTPGMEDVTIYMTEDMKLGQVIDTLQAGTTYYLDMACVVNSGAWEPSAYPGGWPSQLWGGIDKVGYGEGTVAWSDETPPTFHIELWRIPAGVTDGTTIYNAIAASDPDYVKITEAVASATGNLWVNTTNLPAAKWQLIGTTYTAVAEDANPAKNLYVRVYGVHEVEETLPAGFSPEFAFSDVYLSTQPRLVPGGAVTYDIAEGMVYEVIGPYTCDHLSVMGVEIPDLDGNCLVNLEDYAILAGEWLDFAFEMP